MSDNIECWRGETTAKLDALIEGQRKASLRHEDLMKSGCPLGLAHSREIEKLQELPSKIVKTSVAVIVAMPALGILFGWLIRPLLTGVHP